MSPLENSLSKFSDSSTIDLHSSVSTAASTTRTMTPSSQHTNSEPTTKASANPIQTKGPWFVDSYGRVVLLRGVNISGGNKLPSGPGFPRYSHEPRDFYKDEDRNVSFVGRPFPLIEADEHFQRLRSWGFNFFRLCIAWEALEHSGPGIHDEEYMDYVISLLRKAKFYGLKCFIDPHQDVWSRHTGGSGAPGWTLHLAGLDPTQFPPTCAAIVHNTSADTKSFPRMIWPTNYYKLACATMFTLFFGGRDFAPKCIVAPKGPGEEGAPPVNIQDYLQSHFIGSFVALARRIQEAGGLEDSVVVGYDTLNEPSGGFIGAHHLGEHMELQELKNGITPTPFECMRLGEGLATKVETWEMTWAGPRRAGYAVQNTQGARAWLSQNPSACSDLSGCIWANHGVWDRDTGTLLRPDYFAVNPTTKQFVDFARDYWKPFVRKYTSAIRSVHSTAIMFIEPPVNEEPPAWIPEQGDPDRAICYTPHWYDGLTLINKHFGWWSVDYLGVKRGKYSTYLQALRFGEKGTKRCFGDQMTLIKEEGQRLIGDHPCLIGEIGIPYDMDDRYAYRTGDYTQQIKAMDANMCALEANLLNYTLWNYCPDNCHFWGDKWNGEDLSIYSPVPRADLENNLGATSVPNNKANDEHSPSQPLTSKYHMTPVSSSYHPSQVLPRRATATLDEVSDEPNSTRSDRPMLGGNASESPNSTPATTPVAEYSASITSPPSSGTNPPLDSSSRSVSDGTLGTPERCRVSITADASGGSSSGPVPADLDVGGRALPALLRPYPVYTPGTPIRLNFDMRSRTFNFVFMTTPFSEKDEDTEKIKGKNKDREIEDGESSSSFSCCEIYLPKWHYPGLSLFEVSVSDGEWKYFEREQRIHWRHEGEGRHEIFIRPKTTVEGREDEEGDKPSEWYNCWDSCRIL